MGGLLFSNNAMLAGLSALAVPVLIHLLMRRKAVLMRFSSVQFFKQQEQHARKRNIRNFLLLLVRLLLLALLVTAFARPYLPQTVAKVFRKRVVFVLDASASMQATDGGETRWEIARATLLKEIRALDAEDRVAVVRCSTDAEAVVPLSSPQAAVAVVGQMKPAFGTADVAEGVSLAKRILRVEDEVQAEICVISDLQQASCEKIAAVSIPSTTKLRVVPIGNGTAANSAVVSIATTNLHEVQITAANFSTDDATTRSMELVVDGRKSDTAKVTLEPGTGTNIGFTLPALSPGWHDVRAKLSGTDSLASDDSRALAIFVPTPMRVVCVEPAMSRRIFERETFFLNCALRATGGSTDADASALNVEIETVSPDAMAAAIGGTNVSDVVILPALPRISATLQVALERYVANGGKLVTFLGDAVQPNVYREQLARVLPALPLRVEGDPEQPDQFWHLQTPDSKSPMFAVFAKPNSGNITLAQFKRRYVLTAAPSTDVLARFEDGVPFIVSRRVGAGQIVLVNTSATTSWTDWPKRKTFVPWLHSLVHMLAGVERGKAVIASSSCGEFNEVDTKQLVTVRDESGRSKTVSSDTSGKARIDLNEPGVFRVCDASGHEMQRVAVNVPVSESDLTSISEKDFTRKIARVSEESSGGNVTIDGVRQRPLWPMLLGACLVLLLVEVVLANRTNI
ncbi:MAG: double-transrane region domain protein [Verrucomicrobiales bacterium]|nr:double-transrane region domain protein [Verrucomicrobiales bacterium]